MVLCRATDLKNNKQIMLVNFMFLFIFFSLNENIQAKTTEQQNWKTKKLCETETWQSEKLGTEKGKNMKWQKNKGWTKNRDKGTSIDRHRFVVLAVNLTVCPGVQFFPCGTLCALLQELWTGKETYCFEQYSEHDTYHTSELNVLFDILNDFILRSVTEVVMYFLVFFSGRNKIM